MNKSMFMKSPVVLLISILGVITILGCFARSYTPKTTPLSQGIPEEVTITNEFFISRIKIDGAGKSFRFEITNKTKKDLEVDWNKTQFIEENMTKGGFVFEGVDCSKRDEYKPPTIIFPGITFKKNILPKVKVGNEIWSRLGCYLDHQVMDGDVGVYLVVNIDGKEIKEKMLMNVQKIQ
jgi:hypothetical protein